MFTFYLSWGRLWRFIVVACCTICLSGCGLSVQQRAAVQKFSAATIDFATLTSSELVKSRTDVLEMNTLRVQLNDDTVKLDRMDAHFTVERVKERVDEAMARLADNPRPSGVRKLRGTDGYRIRVGDYRVLYMVDDDEKRVLVWRVMARSEGYRVR